MSDQQARNCDATELLPEEIAATIERDWGAAAGSQAPIDATLTTQVLAAAAPASSSRSGQVVVAPRRVHHKESQSPTDAEYDLIRVLGRGGMGVVYQATQASIGRSVAVKMLKGDGDGESKQQQKFIEEAAVTGRLDHPNIVPIYDLGQTTEGLLFYAMKEVRGTPWKEVLPKRTLTDNLRVWMRVADAVAFAHSRGVVHRDLKPENIMLGQFGEVLVMDWGLALVSPQDPTAAIAMGGTPCYMAPEMVNGPPEAIGPHSDIYLFGAILYEIVTGRPPHVGRRVKDCLTAAARNELTPTEQSGELLEIARRALATQPAERFGSVQEFQQAIQEYESHAASILAAARARQGLARAQESGDYDGFARALFDFENALAMWDGNPDARQGLSAARVAYAEAALAKGDYDLGLSTLAADAGEHPELRARLLAAQQERDARRQRLRQARRIVAGLALGLVAVMAVALVWIMKAERQTRRQRDIARIQQQLARDAVDQMLTEVGQEQLADVPQMESVRRSLLNKALVFYLRFLDEQPSDPSVRDETARAYHRVGEISKMLGQHQEAEEAYLRAINIFDQLAVDFPDDVDYRQWLARSRNSLGELYRTLGKSQQAEQQYLAALDRQRNLVSETQQAHTYRQEAARTSYNLGLLYWSLNRPDEARAAYDSAIQEMGALAAAEGLDQAIQHELARALLNRGILNRGTEQTSAARQDYDRAIELLTELTAAAPRNADYRYELATVLNNLGNLLLADAGQRDQTRQVYEQAVKLLESLSKDFPGVLSYRKELANAVNSLAALAYFNQDFDTAERLWQRSRGLARALADDQPQVPENHSLLGRTLGNLGSLMIKQENYEAARDLLSEAIASQKAALETNPDHPEFRVFLRNYVWTLAEAHLALGDHAAAAETAEQLPRIIPDAAAELYRAASLVARCIPLAATVDGGGPADASSPQQESQQQTLQSDAVRADLAESDEGGTGPDPPVWNATQADYATRSLMLLADALEAGFSDGNRLDMDPAFEPLRDDARFAELRLQLAARSKPPRSSGS